MSESLIDWSALERLRQAYLNASAGQQDYWLGDDDLASYDATFAQRIGWKWDHVLAELQGRGWTPPPGEILDWGCGTGVAGRAFLDYFGRASTTALRVWDRSTRAMDWAAAKARHRFPGLPVHAGLGEAPAVLLLSHVLTELDEPQRAQLLDFARQAQAVLWIEPGTHAASRALIAAREILRAEFNVVGPCVHAGRCGLLDPSLERHWCHHFAEPPNSIFQDSFWREFSERAGIDLRSLPLSWLALDRRPQTNWAPTDHRVLGRPRVYKAHALVFGCFADGAREYTVQKREQPEQFRALKKERFASLQRGASIDGAGEG